MNIWAKMITALRGGVNEAGEAIVDTQALRILDQEVRDASEELKQSKDSLAAIMARQKLVEEKCIKLGKAVVEHEGYAIKALEKDDEPLAHEVAQKIADLENQLISEKEAGDGFAESAGQLRAAIKHTDNNIKRLKQQVDTVKATESVQKAQTAVASRHLGAQSKMKTAAESLERIKSKQQQRQAELEAAQELASDESGDGLQAKLKAAGIGGAASSSTDDILARLKNK